jgi:hypothetical protein
MTLRCSHQQFFGEFAVCKRAFWPFGIGLLLALSAQAQEGNVLAANYEFELTIDGQAHSIQDRSLVRSGNEIPIELQDYKVGLRISDPAPDNFLVQVTVYERNGAAWHQITVPPPEFGGKLGIPTDFAWESGGIKLDLAIVVGIYKQ